MSRVALISSGTVANIVVADIEFAQTLGFDDAIVCLDDVAIGDLWNGKKFSHPASPTPPAPTPSYRTTMTPIRFKAQFSVQEQVAIKRARSYAGDDEAKAFARDALDILFGSLDDPRLAEVDVADPSVTGGIDFVQSIGILTADRAAEIKRGVLV